MIDVAPADALELPLDELSLRVLKDLAQHNEGNTLNYLYPYGQVEPYRSNPNATLAIAEALAWLRSHDMIATKLDQSSSQFFFVTRWGHKVLEMQLKDIRALERLQNNLHPIILSKARPQFLLGEYETAILVSMKAVEVRVRKLASYGNEVTGTNLMTQAFKKDGPLADSKAPPGEVQGTMMLFAGAYAVLRNPSGHREVEFDDVTEASEAVMSASLLMRILDKIEKRLSEVTE